MYLLPWLTGMCSPIEISLISTTRWRILRIKLICNEEICHFNFFHLHIEQHEDELHLIWGDDKSLFLLRVFGQLIKRYLSEWVRSYISCKQKFSGISSDLYRAIRIWKGVSKMKQWVCIKFRCLFLLALLLMKRRQFIQDETFN